MRDPPAWLSIQAGGAPTSAVCLEVEFFHVQSLEEAAAGVRTGEVLLQDQQTRVSEVHATVSWKSHDQSLTGHKRVDKDQEEDFHILFSQNSRTHDVSFQMFLFGTVEKENESEVGKPSSLWSLPSTCWRAGLSVGLDIV